MLLWCFVTIVATTVTVASMLLVRRRAPEGSYFTDGDRASGVFGVLATGFSILLGFIIFLGFTSYDESRSGAETEATIGLQQVQTAQFLPDVDAELTGELVCYARYVAGPEWDALAAGKLGDRINPWGAEMFLTISTVDPSIGRRAVRLRPVDGPDLRPRAGADRPDSRRGGHHPRPIVAGALRHLRGRSSPTFCSSQTRQRDE